MTAKKQTNQLQARYLSERLSKAYNEHRYADRDDKEVEPANIKAARALVKSWDEQSRKRRDRLAEERRSLLSKKYNAAKEALLFKSPAEALAAVQKFEREAKAISK